MLNNKSLLFIIVCIFISVNITEGQPKLHEKAINESSSSITKPARKVIRRVIGKRSVNITLETLPAVEGRDTYQIEARNGKLTIRGSSTIALTYGFNQYLQKACHSMVTWSGKYLNLPSRWPDYEGKQVVSPYKYRYYLNVVTFGYTTAFWGWERWQKELDWMALHGINMPLALVGTEAILTRVWRKLGLSNKSIKNYFTGPAYLPWNRMGNITGWTGPLPKGWHKDQVKLQHNILRRMRELGMKPIAPAFGGFVPKKFAQKNPDLTIKELSWGGFAKKHHAHILSPKSDYFKKIGAMFIREWEKEFGKNKFFLSDSFNEMLPPVPKDNPKKKKTTMADYGQSIYQSIKAGDPEAIWVTQGWTFGWQHKFWDPKTLQAFLSKVPDNKMVVLDLANEFPKWRWDIDPVWKTHKGYYGKRWVYSFIPNFGGKTPWTGDLSQYASAPIEGLNSTFSDNLTGFGFAPEGIESNEVVYELLSDMGWREKQINLDQWLATYCQARYGAYPKQMAMAWKKLRKSIYGRFTSYPRFYWQMAEPDPRGKDLAVRSDSTFLSAVKHFLANSDQLKQSKLYRNDAIMLTSIYLGSQADHYYKKALLAQKDNNEVQKKKNEAKTVILLSKIDRLLASHPNAKLSKWIRQARLKGETPAEKDYYEINAKRLITTWGGHLSDYAAKMWSGLIADYYLPRIKLILSGDQENVKAWEQTWIEKSASLKKPVPYARPVAKAKKLIEKFSIQDY